MERFTQGRIVMLGYSTPSSVPKTPLKNSDVDFHDVFGGPPRRYSIHEMQHRYSETMDSSTGLSETLVFGEESENHRRYTSDDFFDDIFRGGGSPRSPSRDPCCSAPASRVLSPARPLPSKAEPFGSALPAPFSLPAKLTKAMEFAAFDPGNCRPYKYKHGISNGISFPYAPSGSRFSSKKIKGQDESRNHIPPSYRQSPLSHEFSLSREEPSCINKVNETKIGGNLKKDSNSEETPSNSNQFHFSIYKWASKGVPLLMPLRGRNSSKSRETGKIDRCSSCNGRIQRDNAVCELPRANVCDIACLSQS